MRLKPQTRTSVTGAVVKAASLDRSKLKAGSFDNGRAGLTLLEVVISLAIFLISLTAISQLMSLSSGNVMEASVRGKAALLCQSKMAEVVAGEADLSAGSGDYDGANKGFEWHLECEQDGDLPGLWNVEVFVKKNVPGRGDVEVSLSQMVFDPRLKGSTTDYPIPAAAGTTGPGGSGN